MKFALTVAVVLGAAPGSAAAETPFIQPGEWMVRSKTTNGIASQSSSRARCLTKEQTADIARTFGPQMGTVNSTCTPPQLDMTVRTLTWRLECRGQLDMNIEGSFEFDGPSHYTATISSKAWMAGMLVTDAKTEVEGERTGECPQ